MSKKSHGYRVAIVSHIWSYGAAHALEEYLRRKGCPYLYIGHPFHREVIDPSFCVRSNPAEGTTRTHAPTTRLREPYRYALDFVFTLWWIMRFGPIDTFIGCGNINALAGLLLRRFGMVRRVVFYAIDYVPVRFDQYLLNTLYHRIERACERWSDWIWNGAPAMIQARLDAGMRVGESAPQVVVPMGGGFDLSGRSRSIKDPATIAFIGHLLEKQGVQVALQALPQVLRVVSNARLLIIGSGPYGDELRDMSVRLGIHEHVEFVGRIDDTNLIRQRLDHATVGIALYLQELDRWTKYAEPGKIKDYLAAGMPIIITDVPAIARRLESCGAGLIVEPTPLSVAQVAAELLTDRAMCARMSEAAFLLAEEYDWERIFDHAFQSSVGAVV